MPQFGKPDHPLDRGSDVVEHMPRDRWVAPGEMVTGGTQTRHNRVRQGKPPWVSSVRGDPVGQTMDEVIKSPVTIGDLAVIQGGKSPPRRRRGDDRGEPGGLGALSGTRSASRITSLADVYGLMRPIPDQLFELRRQGDITVHLTSTPWEKETGWTPCAP